MKPERETANQERYKAEYPRPEPRSAHLHRLMWHMKKKNKLQKENP
jgi:hypothetical protein